MKAPAPATALVVAAGLASAYQWPQTAGGASRWNVFPPATGLFLTGLEAEAERPSPTNNLRSNPNPVLVPTAINALQYTLTGTTEVLQKTAPPVVLKSGTVVVVGSFCDLIGLPSPDAPGVSWASPAWLTRAEEDLADGANCYDVLVDEGDNLLHVRHERNNIDNDTFVGYGTMNGKGLSAIPALAGIDTLSSLPLFVIFNVMSTYVPIQTMSTPGNPQGLYYMPSSPTLSGKGLVVVTTNQAAAAASGLPIGGDNLGKVAGGVGYPTPGANDGSYQVAFATSSSGLTNVPMVMAFNGGIPAWVSGEAPLLPSLSGVQAPPLYIPDTSAPGGGRIYMVPNPNDPTKQTNAVYCFTTLGGDLCPGFPQPLPVTLDGVKTGWWYGGAVVPTPGTPSTVARLIYTVDSVAGTGPEHIGCLVALSPNVGKDVDHYCVARDANGRQAAANFLATAPVVAVNARGPGLHTVFVAQYDAIVLAFDPMNLQAGPLSVWDPTPATDRNGIALTSDYLTFTAGGSLIMVAWRKGTTDGQYVVTAIQGATGTPAGPGGPAGPGLGPGGAAAIAVVVLTVVGAAVAFPLYRSGQLQSFVRSLVPGSVRYTAVGGTGASSYLVSSGSGYRPGSKSAGVPSSGGYGAFAGSSASA